MTRFLLWTAVLAGLIIPLQAAEPSKPLPPKQTVRFAPTGEILFNPGCGLFQTCNFRIPRNAGTNTAHAAKVWTNEEINKEIEEQFDVLPYISTVYYRFNWISLEPEEGKYRWDEFEALWRPWVERGKKIAFRIMAYCPSGVFPESKEIFYHTPKYVFDAGAMGFINKEHIMVPIFGDPIFLEKYGKLVKAVAERYDDDPRIAFVEIGAVGAWGEGGGYTPECHDGLKQLKLSPEVAKEVNSGNPKARKAAIDIHMKYFQEAPLSIAFEPGGEDYPASKGVMIRNDSLNHGWDSSWTRMNSPDRIYKLKLFDKWWLRVPCLAETANDPTIQKEVYLDPLKGSNIYRELLTHHPSYISLPQWTKQGVEFVRKNPGLARDLAIKVGYRYVLQEATYDARLEEGSPSSFALIFQNDGVALLHEPFVLNVFLTDGEGKTLWETTITPSNKNTEWLPGTPITETFQVMVPQDKIPNGSYQWRLKLSLVRNGETILLAVDGRDKDGRVFVGDVAKE